MTDIAIVIINYFHDLAVAMLACSVLSIYLLGRWTASYPDSRKLLAHSFRRFSAVAYLSLTYIIIGGAIRAYNFKEYEWNPALAKGLIMALVIKHVILGILTLVGLIVVIRYTRKYGKDR